MAPSGVQKERMQKADMFVLDADGSILETPVALPPPAKPPKLSECSPLFMSVSLYNGLVAHYGIILRQSALFTEKDGIAASLRRCRSKND